MDWPYSLWSVRHYSGTTRFGLSVRFVIGLYGHSGCCHHSLEATLAFLDILLWVEYNGIHLGNVEHSKRNRGTQTHGHGQCHGLNEHLQQRTGWGCFQLPVWLIDLSVSPSQHWITKSVVFVYLCFFISLNAGLRKSSQVLQCISFKYSFEITEGSVCCPQWMIYDSMCTQEWGLFLDFDNVFHSLLFMYFKPCNNNTKYIYNNNDNNQNWLLILTYLINYTSIS